MTYTNITTIKNFVISGFPGLPPEYYGYVSALLLLVYLVIVFGNAFILTFIMWEQTLHKPTYWIFFHLAMTDLGFATVTLPKIITGYWWNDMVSSFGACFTQMYFVHSLGATHSLILMMMALDRFVAIWFPFRYPLLLTNKTVSIACSLCWILSYIDMLFIVFLTLSLPFCNINVIMQCYCDHGSILQLGCGENVPHLTNVSFANAMVILLVPLIFVFFSYFTIIIFVLKMKMSHTERSHKVLSTCAPQIFITCLFYVPRCFVYLTYTIGFSFSPVARIIIIMMYSLIPAAVNPVIYCFKTKDIKKALMKRLKNTKVNIETKTDSDVKGNVSNISQS
ncbi:olfactory receptor 52E8-like [Pholidichthys leucotaenia]